MEQTINRFEQVNEIFSDALSRPEGERESYVQRACRGDSGLQASVIRLLSRFDRLGGFLTTPALATAAAQDQELRLGDLLAARFRIHELLGRGGMGEVYLAEDLTLGEMIAIKTVRAQWRRDATMLARFRDEIKLARRVSHPNVCRIFDQFTSTVSNGEELDFFTMEFLDGETLAETLTPGQPLDRAQTLAISAGIAAGLDASHREGIVHRDLKPGNIILVRDRQGQTRPVIADFGLAKFDEAVEGSVTESAIVAGSPNYMSPEQFLGEPITAAADIFAFALIVFEMASGHRPYPDETIMRAAVRRITGEPVPLRSVAPQAPRNWERALTRALARDPSGRPESAEMLVEEMRDSSVSFDIARVHIARPSRRSLMAAGAAGIALASFLGFRRYSLRGLPSAPVIMATPIKSSGHAEDARALSLQIEKGLLQSGYVSLLDSGAIGRTWLRMGRQGPPPPVISTSEAREIALRSGADFVLFGELERGSDEWALKVKLEQMGSSSEHPQYEQTSHFYADTDQRLLTAGAKAVDWVRRTAGESAGELTARSRAPEEVTTSSWEALKEFTSAEESWRERAEDKKWPPDQRAAAEEHLTRALQLDPQFASAAGLLADFQVSAGEFDMGMASYQRAAELIDQRNLTDRESLRIRGLFYADTDQFSSAEKVFTRYTLEYPREAAGFLYRATSVHCQGRMEEALHLYTEAVQRDSGNHSSSFHNNLAACLLAVGRIADAEREIEAAGKLRDGDWTDQLRCALAFARFDAGKLEDRIDHIRKTGSLPYRGKVFLLEACWRAELGDWARAESLLRQGLHFDIENSQPQETYAVKLRAMAQLYLRQGRNREAAVSCNQILELNPGLPFVLEAGSLLARAGNPAAARRCVPQSLPEEPPKSVPQVLPTGARRELMEWPRYWRRILLLWAEIAMAEGSPKTAFELLANAPPPDIREEWPEALVRASVASGERRTAEVWLQKLAANPGSYWFWAEIVGPGFIREASGRAESLGLYFNDWAFLRQFINLKH